MLKKKPSDKSNGNLRQQESSVSTLERDFDTTAEKQSAQTASVIDGSKVKNKGNTQKQHSNQTHAENEFKQKESTTSKMDRTIDNAAQKQFTQTANVTDASPVQQQGKLQKQFSNQNDHAKNEFKQKESTTSKMDRTIDTAAQKQFTQTANVTDASPVQQQGKLQKQFSNQNDHAKNEFKQKKSTTSKIDRTVDNAAQKQFTQTANVTDASPVQQQGKLQKQFSNQNDHAKNEFKQKKSTTSKIDKTINTTDKKQFAQTASLVHGSSNDSQNKLQKRHSTRGKVHLSQSTSSTGVTTNKFKLKKQNFNQASEKFKQKENTAIKIDRTINTAGQKRIDQTVKATSKTKNKTNSKLQNPKNSNIQKKIKLRAKQLGKGTIVATSSALKTGAKKYQKTLEQGDAEGVKLSSQGITAVAKVSLKSVKKLRQQHRKIKSFKKGKANPLYKVKPEKFSSLKKVAKTPGLVLENGTKKYQKSLEKDDEGVKLASQGSTQIAKATKKLISSTSKINAKSGKLGKKNSKLSQSQVTKNAKMKVTDKATLKKKAIKKKTLKKKAIKKKLYAPYRSKSKAINGALSSFSNRISNIFKNIGKFKFSDIKSLVATKVAAFFGGGLVTILPVLLVAILLILIISAIGASTSPQNIESSIGGSQNLSAEVENWRELVEREAAAQGMSAYVSLLLAIIQVETGGKGTRDIMQSSESAGYPRNYWPTEELSVRQGVTHLKNIVNILLPYNSGYENNSLLLAQSYNFGSAFAGYVGRRGGEYTLDVAEAYSRDVVAPSLGNFTGMTYSYVNAISTRLGKTYLYRNGGNFMYGDLVGQYIGIGSGAGAGVTGDFRIVVDELEKYLGWSYVWGGKNPSTGFDCSGFVSWGLAQIGITLPSYAASQYDLTVPIDPSEAQPGDLIFFKGTYGGPNHVSHVGFYIDQNTMLDSNGSGVGYHNWKDSYWQKHYAGIRRVVR